jgi:hypothetical protein
MTVTTAAENKPAYRLLVDARNKVEPDLKTHENQYPISIFLPPFGHLIVIFLCNLGIHVKDRA